MKRAKGESKEMKKVAEKKRSNRKECPEHKLKNEEEAEKIRSSLLSWYAANARTLPWRTAAITEKDENIRGYAVLVSEIMLQQTQVATVIDYYKKWMKQWPSTKLLAKATLEEVNQAWAGLGYYSRGRRLWEGAKRVEDDLNGVMPRNSAALAKLPGVGRYTAAAVGSIAYGEPTGLVDGNVVRVLTRLRGIGADSSSQIVTERLWELANQLIDPDQPGDFNQSLMELGATVCTPKSPNCSGCPLKDNCQAYARKASKQWDIEDACDLCPSEKLDPGLGVTNYPRKTKKLASRSETTLVLLLYSQQVDGVTRLAVTQRPATGLLAGLHEFISVPIAENASPQEEQELLACSLAGRQLQHKDLKRVGEMPHIFSHINMKYVVFTATCTGNPEKQDAAGLSWKTEAEFLELGTSTAMKKILKMVEETGGTKRKRGEVGQTPKKKLERGKQPSISAFFRPV